MTRQICITGAGSGMGAATAALFEKAGDRVIGVDLRNAEITADLGTPEGRVSAIDAVRTACDGRLDGLVTFAGLGGIPTRSGALLAAVNYFGTVTLLDGLRPLLATASEPAAVAISSNSTTIQPGVPKALIDAFLSGDEDVARRTAEEAGAVLTYPASKVAVAYWVRHHAPSAEWAGAGITLNAIAPGLIETPLSDEIKADPTMGPMIEAFPVPVGRPGRPEEIAAVVEFLLSPNARFFCGTVLFADGGSDALIRPDAWPVPLSLS